MNAELEHKIVTSLAECIGYLNSVRTDRKMEVKGNTFVLQTMEWAEGAQEFAANANAVLLEYEEKENK